MNPHDIPNAFMVGLAGGDVLVVPFDDNGKAADEGTTMDMPKSFIADARDEQGRLTADTVALVHSVEGDKEWLVKCIVLCKVTKNGEPMSVAGAVEAGTLKALVEKMRRDYVRMVEKGGEDVKRMANDSVCPSV